MTPFFFIFGLVIVACVVMIGVWRMTRKRGLSGGSKQRVMAAWNHVEQLQDPVRKVLEADKVLDLALTELGYVGSVADKLKKAEPRFKNLQSVWDAHKLRNHLAHQPGAQVNSAEAERAVQALKKGIEGLM